METYPSYKQFRTKFAKTDGNFAKLNKISYKLKDDQFEISGIQLHFEDDSKSQNIDINSKDPKYSFKID